MVNHKIKMADIDARDRLRPIDPAHVELIAASIAEQGLLQPVRVRAGADGGYILIAGAHRFAALEALGRKELIVGEEVLIADVSEARAKIDEIDENLARHELNALDRAIFLAKRKELYLAGNPEAARGKASKLKGIEKGQTLAFFSRSFARVTAERVGLSKSTINQAVQLAEKLDAHAIASLRGTAVENNQKELLALSLMPRDEQQKVALAMGAKKIASVAKARVVVGLDEEKNRDPQSGYLASARYAVSKMDARTLKSFMAENGWINAPAAAEDSAKARPRGVTK
jgi:ParB family transcriptional regulator, chromosome partitioning protein